jgi:peptidoglycan hydrolase-like protein with peptidoglycan-binding domain
MPVTLGNKFKGNLTLGMRGINVKDMQNALDSANDILGFYDGAIVADGVFGRKTHSALLNFQMEVNINPSGVYDYQTHRSLDLTLSNYIASGGF